MALRIFNKLKMGGEAKKSIVINPKLKLMGDVTSKSLKFRSKVGLMDEVKKTDGLTLTMSKKLKIGKSLHMDTFSETSTAARTLEKYPEQEVIKTPEVIDVPHHIQLRMKVRNGVVTVVGARKVDGGFVKETNLHLNEGLVYEVTKGTKRLQFGVIPDFGVRRSFPNPNPKNEAEKGHSISVSHEIDFNVRVLPNDVSLASLKSLKVDLYRAKSAISSQLTNETLDKQFDVKLRKMASLQRIDIAKLPKTLQNSFQKALK